MIDDAALVGLFKNGVPEAFDAIYRHYYRPIYNYVNKLVKDKHMADDLTQETLIKVLGGLKDVDENKGLAPWIFRIAHNTCMDHHRRSKVKYELKENIKYQAAEDSCPEHILLNKEKQNKLKEALYVIGKRYRTVLLMRACKSLSYKDIANQLQLNESTVKTLMRRGRQQLQKAYAEVY